MNAVEIEQAIPELSDRGLGSQPIIVVINFGSDCEGDWAKLGRFKNGDRYLDSVFFAFFLFCNRLYQ
jgi:hypothetical protein